MQFKEFHKQLRVSFAIYADFESLTTKIESVSQDPSKSSTEKYQHHQARGFAYAIVSEKPDYCKAPVVYRGEDAIEKFLEMLLQEEAQIASFIKDITPMNLTPGENEEFKNSTHCHICQKELDEKDEKVRDQCHITSVFRGADHKRCNYHSNRHIPVILHNMRRYDSHLIMQGLGKVKHKDLNCIANNMEH